MSAVGVKAESDPIDSLAYNARAKFAAERAKVMSDTAEEFRRIKRSGNEREDADKQAERDAKSPQAWPSCSDAVRSWPRSCRLLGWSDWRWE
jgi:hypothetical protein